MISSLLGFLVAIGEVLLVVAVGEVLLVVVNGEVLLVVVNGEVLLGESWLLIFVAHKIGVLLGPGFFCVPLRPLR